MQNQSFNRVVYNYVVVEKDEFDNPIGLTDVKIMNSQEYVKLKDECSKNRKIKEARDAESAVKAEEEKSKLENAARIAKEESARLKEFEAYQKRFSFSKFLTVYNYLKVRSFEGKTNLVGEELDSLLDKVMKGKLSVEGAVNSVSDFKEIFDHLEVN